MYLRAWLPTATASRFAELLVLEAYPQHLVDGQEVDPFLLAFFRVVFGGPFEILDEVLIVFHAEVAHERLFEEKQVDPCEAVDVQK